MRRGGGVGICLSLSFIFFSFSFKHQLFSQRLEQLEHRYGLGEVVEINALSTSQFKRLCFYTPNPMFCLNCLNVYNMCLPASPQHLMLSWMQNNAISFIKKTKKKTQCVQIIALIQSRNLLMPREVLFLMETDLSVVEQWCWIKNMNNMHILENRRYGQPWALL